MPETLWIVRAKQRLEALDMTGEPTTLEPGQRGWFPIEHALDAAHAGALDILSPDGIEALQRSTPPAVITEDTHHAVQTETPAPTANSTPEPAVEASVAATRAVEPAPIADAAPVTVAPVPPRLGPQLKRLKPKA